MEMAPRPDVVSSGHGLDEAAAHPRAHPGLHRVSNILLMEFDGLLPPRTVLQHVAQARELLVAAGLKAGLPWATEAMARSRLSALLTPGACSPRTGLLD